MKNTVLRHGVFSDAFQPWRSTPSRPPWPRSRKCGAMVIRISGRCNTFNRNRREFRCQRTPGRQRAMREDFALLGRSGDAGRSVTAIQSSRRGSTALTVTGAGRLASPSRPGTSRSTRTDLATIAGAQCRYRRPRRGACRKFAMPLSAPPLAFPRHPHTRQMGARVWLREVSCGGDCAFAGAPKPVRVAITRDRTRDGLSPSQQPPRGWAACAHALCGAR